jgi:hypothetical protein
LTLPANQEQFGRDLAEMDVVIGTFNELVDGTIVPYENAQDGVTLNYSETFLKLQRVLKRTRLPLISEIQEERCNSGINRLLSFAHVIKESNSKFITGEDSMISEAEAENVIRQEGQDDQKKVDSTGDEPTETNAAAEAEVAEMSKLDYQLKILPIEVQVIGAIVDGYRDLIARRELKSVFENPDLPERLAYIDYINGFVEALGIATLRNPENQDVRAMFNAIAQPDQLNWMIGFIDPKLETILRENNLIPKVEDTAEKD